MGSENKRYAIGEFGKLIQFTGGKIPEGTNSLVEEDGETLTEAGKQYCKARARPLHVESIRVIFAHQSGAAMVQAVEASAKNQDLREERDMQTKAMSERLKNDWAAQDKAYKASEAARK